MSVVSGALLFVMAVLAGIINSAVGSGSLLTLPVLLALGVPPGVAVRTNTTGMMFASVGSAWGFRKEIRRELPYLGPLVLVTIVASATGSLLLLASPSHALDFVIPILIVVALVMVTFQPRLTRWLAARSQAGQEAAGDAASGAEVGQAYRRPRVVAPLGLAAVYGGYFTAAQGILYMAILSVMTGRSLKAINPVKNFLSLFVNVTAALVYLVSWAFFGAEILWIGVAVVAAGGLVGGLVGAQVAKRLPNQVLRAVIVVVALVALVRQFV